MPSRNIFEPLTNHSPHRLATVLMAVMLWLVLALTLEGCYHKPSAEEIVESLIADLPLGGPPGEKARDKLIKMGAPAVEPLVAALNDPATEERSSIAGLLGEIGDPRAIEPLIVALDDADRGVRFNAARSLGELGDPRAVEPLIAAFEQDLVRQEALEALEKIGDPRAVEAAVLAIAEDRGADIGKRILQRYGAEAAESWTKLLESQDPELRGRVVAMISLYVEDSSMLVRDDPQLLEALLGYVFMTTGVDRAQAIFEVADIVGATWTADALAMALGDSETSMRLAGLDGLWLMYDMVCTWDLPDCREAVRSAAQKAVDPLIAILNEQEDIEIRSQAIELLGESDDARAVQALIDALEFAGPLRGGIAHALGRLGDPAALPAVEGLWQDGDEFVRENAIEALASIGGGSALEILLEALGDESKEIRETALDSLTRMDDQALVPLLDALRTGDLETVAEAYRFFILRGEAGSERVLVRALIEHGNKEMASYYLNCGNAILEEGARDWAMENGYLVVEIPSPGGGGATWGSSP